MSFENPNQSVDQGHEKMKATLMEYFEDYLENLQATYAEEKDQMEINNIILDLDKNDFESASLYLQEELERLKERKVKIRGSIGEQDTLRVLEVALSETQKLWDSLQLKEK